MGSDTFSPSDNPSTTSTASALIFLNGDNGNILGADSILGTNIRTDLRSLSNVTDVFVYDTSKDPDAGAWRSDDRAKSSSWYNETIDNISATCIVDTSDRCGTRDFPVKAIIVTTTTKLYIFDAKDNTLWMDFAKGSGATEQMIGPTTNSTGSSVWALNGKVYYANNGSVGGLYVIDFKTDKSYKYNATDDYVGNLTIANRNTTTTYVSDSSLGPTATIVDTIINSVMVSILRSGETMVIVATDTGISTINETNKVIYSYSDVTGDDYNSAYISRFGDLYGLNETQQQLEVWNNAGTDTASELNGTPDKVWDQTTDPPLFQKNTAQNITIGPKAISVADGESASDDKSDVIYVAHADGVTRIQHNRTTTTNGWTKFYTKDYISEELDGDARLSLPMTESAGGNGAIRDVSNAANQLTNNGSVTFGVSGVRGTGMTFTQGTSDYLCSETGVANGSCDDDSDFDNTTGDMSVGAWVKRSASGTDVDVIAADWGNAIGDQEFRLYFDATDFPTFQTTDGTSTTTSVSPTAITDTNWHHITAQFNNSTANIQYLYVDGRLVDSDTASSTDQPNNTVAFTIGADLSGAANTAANFFRGTIDEVYYDREGLDPSYIRRIYESGYRALQNHTSSRITGISGADNYQRLLGNASGGTAASNNATSIAIDDTRRFIYAGLHDATTNTGGVTVIAEEADTAIDLFDSTANTSKDDDIGTQFSANDVVSISLSGSPCPGYNGGSTTCNNSATLAIAGTNDSATRVWMETSTVSIADALSLLGSTSLTKNIANITSVLQVYDVYNRNDDDATGGEHQVPALKVDSTGMFTYNYLNTQTSSVAMDINDSTHTSGTVIDISGSAINSGEGINLSTNALTTGRGLLITSSATGCTSCALELITHSGSNANNTGYLLQLANTGTLNANTSFYIQHYATGTNNLAMRIDDESADTTPFAIDGLGNVGIGDSSPDYTLELYDPTNTPVIVLSDDDIAQGFTTDVAATDAFLHISSISTTAGGAQFTGLSSGDAQAFSIRGGIDSSTPANTTPAIKIIGGKLSGTTFGDLDVDSTQGGTNAETVFQIANNDDTASFTMLGNGNIGIGNQVTPLAKLHVISNPLAALYTTGRAAAIFDQFENQDIIAASASGVTKLRVTNTSDVIAERFVDLGNTSGTFYIDPANGTTSIVVDGAIISDGAFSITSNGTNGNVTISAGTGDVILGTADSTGAEVCVSLDGSTCTGKIDAATFDPPYTINDKNYATYAPSMTGIKEETVGTIQTSTYVAGIGYKTEIDFTDLPIGSDLWLFSRTTDLKTNADQLVVLLSPASSARVWYSFDPDALILTMYSSRPTSVSYRLTAPRFDWQQWANTRADDDRRGMTLNYDNAWFTGSGSAAAPEDPLAHLTIEPVDESTLQFRIRHENGDIIEEATSFARLLVANVQTGAIRSINGIFGKVVITESITSPVAQIDSVRTNSISPIATESGQITVNLNQTQSFGIKNTDTNTVTTTFDALGNATLSGTLTTENLNINGDATVAGALTSTSVTTEDAHLDSLSARQASVSGQLYADRIVTNFGDLDTRFQTIEQSIDSISTQSAIAYTNPTPSTSPAADYGGAISLSGGDVVVNTNLFVLGDSLLSRTSITGSLLVDGVIRFAENVIETISETLYIQKNKLASVDILDGTIIADIWNRVFVRGTLGISGNTTIGGVLGASTLSPITGSNLTIDLNQSIPDPFALQQATPSSGFADLVIKGINNQTVATINASGSATFTGTVAADMLVASGSATVSKLNISTGDVAASTDSAIPSSSVGTGLLPANFTEITVLSNQIAADSLVYLTPLSSTGNQVIYVKEKLPGVGFIVAIDSSLSIPINFNWWIIN